MADLGSHAPNSALISRSAVDWSHVDGSVSSGCDKTMLKAFPAPIVYVMTWRLSPILRRRPLVLDLLIGVSDGAHQIFRAGFSKSHAVSGSSFMRFTSTVAL